MSNIFKAPSTPKLPPPPESIEEIETIEETAEEARKREKKKLLAGGRQSTIISGIASALKSRLGD